MSISYFTLSEATALDFIAPLGAIMLTRCLQDDIFRMLDVIACTTALAGVVLVLQPTAIYGTVATDEISTGIPTDPHAHLKGVAFGITGVAGGIVSLK